MKYAIQTHIFVAQASTYIGYTLYISFPIVLLKSTFHHSFTSNRSEWNVCACILFIRATTKEKKKNTWKPIYLKDIVSQKHKQRHIHKHIHITHFAVCKTYIILILRSFFNYNYWIKWISCLGFFIDWNIFAYMPLLCYSIQHADIVHSSVCICRRRK